MTFEGGCYCRAVRYEAEGNPILKAQCHCRECQYISGGAENVFMVMPPDGFRYIKGTPKSFTRGDLEKPVTREFCSECGTAMQKHCTNCNADLAATAKFCAECGTPASAPA